MYSIKKRLDLVRCTQRQEWSSCYYRKSKVAFVNTLHDFQEWEIHDLKFVQFVFSVNSKSNKVRTEHVDHFTRPFTATSRYLHVRKICQVRTLQKADIEVVTSLFCHYT